MVINLAETTVKCPVAPLEFTFLADAFFSEKGIRDKVEIFLITPLSGAFTKPKVTKMSSSLLEKKTILIKREIFQIK